MDLLRRVLDRIRRRPVDVEGRALRSRAERLARQRAGANDVHREMGQGLRHPNI